MHNAKFIFVMFVIIFLAIAITLVFFGAVDNFFVRLATVFGQFQIQPEAPTVEAIYLLSPTMGLTNCTDTFTDCSTDPLEASTRYPTIKVMVRDGDGNCNNDGLFDIYVTVCIPGTGDCNSTTYDRTIELSYAGEQSSDLAYCNYSTTGVGFDYYETPGNWGIYANVTDDDGTQWNSNEPYSFRFEYTSFVGFRYPGAGSTVNMGALSLGMWNNGTGDTAPTDPTAWNTGNVQQNITWNTSDFVSGANTLEITGTNYAIDDDKDGTDDTGNLEQIYIHDDPSQKIIFPTTYLQVCSIFACDGAGDDDAKYNTYWHIFIPAGQPSGTYQNNITITNVEL